MQSFYEFFPRDLIFDHYATIDRDGRCISMSVCDFGVKSWEKERGERERRIQLTLIDSSMYSF